MWIFKEYKRSVQKLFRERERESEREREGKNYLSFSPSLSLPLSLSPSLSPGFFPRVSQLTNIDPPKVILDYYESVNGGREFLVKGDLSRGGRGGRGRGEV